MIARLRASPKKSLAMQRLSLVDLFAVASTGCIINARIQRSDGLRCLDEAGEDRSWLKVLSRLQKLVESRD